MLASASQDLGLKVCSTVPGVNQSVFMFVVYFKVNLIQNVQPEEFLKIKSFTNWSVIQ